MFKRILSCISVFALLLLTVMPADVFADTETKPLEGRTISVLGDSISTYIGWSDANPITGEECTYRYGEAYYGPEGGDFHNTDLLVTDTWWHQGATELGAEILISNAGNSTGIMYASYPSNPDWQTYLQDMRAYMTRPYYLGTETQDPDIIALYIGSSDVARYKVSKFGSIDDIDFDTLITQDADGNYVYAEPETVAEAYSIMLHKIMTTYPDAEIYCFTVVPNSGGTLATCNTRLATNIPFNNMIKGVAEYHGAYVVDIFEAFALDPDGDGVATQEDFDTFKTYFNGDPHPNAAGFDVISKCFVDTVKANTQLTPVIDDENPSDPEDPSTPTDTTDPADPMDPTDSTDPEEDTETLSTDGEESSSGTDAAEEESAVPDSNPQTGDEANITSMILLAASAVLLAVMVSRRNSSCKSE